MTRTKTHVIAASLGAALVFGSLLFGGAGRVDLPWFWAYIGGWAVYVVASSTLALRINPDLIQERMAPPSDRDRTTRRLAVGPALGHLLVAGLDVRFGWSTVPLAVHLLGFALLSTGWIFIGWTFVANRFASSAVRIQQDRGQTVVTTGPYAIVRHPMYLGVVLITLGSGLALGSWWSAALVSTLIPIFVRRTRLEDAMLMEELAGYRQYAERTRWRVVPGVF